MDQMLLQRELRVSRRCIVAVLVLFAVGVLIGLALHRYHDMRRERSNKEAELARKFAQVDLAPKLERAAAVEARRRETIEADRIAALGVGKADCSVFVSPRKPTVVALVFGQSNAANSGEARTSSRGSVYQYYKGKCYRAVDPLIWADGEMGSVWPEVGDELIRTGRFSQVLFVPIAEGGSKVEYWIPGAKHHGKLVSALDHLRQSGIEITHVLWHQGESDRGGQKHDYLSSFRSIVANLRERGITAPVFVSVASYWNGTYSESIHLAQKELVAPEQGIFPGPDTDALGGDHRYDGVHFSTEGMRKVAALWVEAIMRQLPASR